MIHSSRRDRKAKAIAEVLAMIDDTHPELSPPCPVRAESATEFCAALDRYAERAVEIKRENRRPPSALVVRPAPCCTNPTPAIHYMPGRDIVEVLTKCRAEHLMRGDVRFVAAGA